MTPERGISGPELLWEPRVMAGYLGADCAERNHGPPRGQCLVAARAVALALAGADVVDARLDLRHAVVPVRFMLDGDVAREALATKLIEAGADIDNA